MNPHSLRPLGRAALALVLACALTGCGPQSGTVSGKITVKNKAPNLDGLQLSFLGSDGRVAMASVNADGTYQASGVPAGVVKIGIVTQQTSDPAAVPPNVRPTDGSAPDPRALARWEEQQREAAVREAARASIPDKLRDPLGSGLVVTVEPNKMSTFDYDVK
jgi:hypothetical protein